MSMRLFEKNLGLPLLRAAPILEGSEGEAGKLVTSQTLFLDHSTAPILLGAPLEIDESFSQSKYASPCDNQRDGRLLIAASGACAAGVSQLLTIAAGEKAYNLQSISETEAAGGAVQPLEGSSLEIPIESLRDVQQLQDAKKLEVPQGGNGLDEVKPTRTSKELYYIGYKHILVGDYRAAEAVFLAFLKRYPQDPLHADAHFWLGEALFAQKRYREAADVYIATDAEYKGGGLGAENLLKLGIALSQLNDKGMACEIFKAAFERYPHMEAALRNRVQVQQGQNACL
ncbi:tol-pal system protein YbgF [Bartonella sp. DGB2]|uniref:tol-pal system protein YbgF n=1 Tax=Bartonella sp. DGB2 TaxID=3388426 RepID=UPI00398FBF01